MSLHDVAATITKRKREFSPEWRAKLAEAMRKRWEDPAYRESQVTKILTTKRSAAGRKRQAAKLKKFHTDPERGLKARAQALRAPLPPVHLREPGRREAWRHRRRYGDSCAHRARLDLPLLRLHAGLGARLHGFAPQVRERLSRG